jgi:hypothetical protein
VKNLVAIKVDIRNVQFASTQQRFSFLETAFRFSPKHPCTLDWLVADCTNRARNTVQTIFASDSQKEENKQKHITIILFLKVSRCLLS